MKKRLEKKFWKYRKLTTDIVPHIKIYMEEKLPKYVSFEATFASLMQELGIFMMNEYETVCSFFFVHVLSLNTK